MKYFIASFLLFTSCTQIKIAKLSENQNFARLSLAKEKSKIEEILSKKLYCQMDWKKKANTLAEADVKSEDFIFCLNNSLSALETEIELILNKVDVNEDYKEDIQKTLKQ